MACPSGRLLPGFREGYRLLVGSTGGSEWSPAEWDPDGVLLVIARNPDPDSALPFLLRVPLAGGLVFRTSGTWPRVKALYCYPVPLAEWPAEPEIVEQVGLRSCARRGPAIDLVLDRGRENRSQIVFTTARGRQAVFWQSPRTRKQARPNVSTPTARAAGIARLQIIVDAHERYAYKFASQQVDPERGWRAWTGQTAHVQAGEDAKTGSWVRSRCVNDPRSTRSPLTSRQQHADHPRIRRTSHPNQDLFSGYRSHSTRATPFWVLRSARFPALQT